MKNRKTEKEIKEKNYIEKLREKKKRGEPVVVLAPMADVTDCVFREMIADTCGKSGPDIYWTEFVSADGLCSAGREHLLRDLEFNKEKESPILAQIFGSKVEHVKEVTRLVYDLGFDGVDFNFGCPVDVINKQGSGAAVIKTPDLAKSLVLAAKEEISKCNPTTHLSGELNTKDKTKKKIQKDFFSLSLKTRIGYNKIEYETWFPYVLSCEPDIFTVHLRTRKEMSLVPAHYEISKDIVRFIKKYCKENKLKVPFIILNGDVKDVGDARVKIKKSGADGMMIGRGVFGTPWLFNEKEYEKRKEVGLKTKKQRENLLFRFETMLEHTKRYEKRLCDIKSFNIMKKHYKAYINGFDGAKDLRVSLMAAKDYKEVKKIVDKFVKENIK